MKLTALESKDEITGAGHGAIGGKKWIQNKHGRKQWGFSQETLRQSRVRGWNVSLSVLKTLRCLPMKALNVLYSTRVLTILFKSSEDFNSHSATPHREISKDPGSFAKAFPTRQSASCWHHWKLSSTAQIQWPVLLQPMVNTIGIGPQLINVQLSQSSIYDITSSLHLSMVDEHDVPINLCPQNKICISQENPFHKKSWTSSGVLQPRRLEVQHWHNGYLALQGRVYMPLPYV